MLHVNVIYVNSPQICICIFPDFEYESFKYNPAINIILNISCEHHATILMIS